MRKLLVFGRTGQVARELARHAPGALFAGREVADLGVPGSARDLIEAERPDAIINAAAWTAVDAAEKAREAAFRVNGEAPGEIARAAADTGAVVVQISTDYVFDGAGGRPWKPTDPTGPLGVYGASKLAGEQAVRSANGPHAILRTSWVFSAHGQNFVKTMLRLSESRDRLTVVADQVGGPTPAGVIAAACLTMARVLRSDPGKSGTYHLSGAPDTSWAGFAREIFARSGRIVEVSDIPSAEYPTPAPRPANSRLDCESTERVFGIARPDWRVSLDEVLADLRSMAGQTEEIR